MPGPSNRSIHSTHPSMGLPARWKISDLPNAYTTPATLTWSSIAPNTTAATGNVTSDAFNPQANSIEVYTGFSDGVTKCDIIVLNDDGTGNFVPVATFPGVNLFKEGNLYVGELDQNITLQGRAIKVQLQNFSGTGTVTVRVARLN